MMMMKYKLANKLNKRFSVHAASSDEIDMNQVSTPSSPVLKRIQPKRVSLCSIGERDDDSALSVVSCSSDMMIGRPVVLESPIPTFKKSSSIFDITKKPSKLAPPSDICFAPIGSRRRLDFETPTRPMTLDGRDWSLPPPLAARRRAAVVTPRDTPDSTSGPTFELCQRGTLPPALYIPTSDEQEAATLLMSLKKEGDDEKLRGPLLFTPPKRRRVTKNTWSNMFIDDLEDEDEDDSSSEESYHPVNEEPTKKRKKLHRSSRKTSKRANRGDTTTSKSSRRMLSTRTETTPASLGDNTERSIRLAMPDDSQHLNSLHCFVRSDLLEVFVMDEHKRKHRDLEPRVGFRCVHCGLLPRKEKEGASMSIFYPKSLQDIYRSVCTWQRIHFKACRHVPQPLVERYDYLKEMDRTRGKKQHWVNSAHKLGLRNIDKNRGGIVFGPEK